MVTKTGVAHGVYWNPQSTPLTPFINYKKQYPDVPVLLVFNPFGGVGTARVDWYAEEIRKCQRAGIEAYGYVYTQWDARDANVVNQEVKCYKRWYCCDGIFYDELSNSTNPPTYVDGLDDFANTRGLGTMGNPGTSIASNYIGLMDNYVIYENAGLSDLSWIPTTYPGVDKSNFTAVFYDVPTLSDAQIETMAEYVGWLFVSEVTLVNNPYNSITSYLEQLYRVLDGVPAS